MKRRGFTLPFVIIAIGASATLALALITTAWRGHRSSRHGRQAEGVALATDRVLAEAQLAWRADSVWMAPLGTAATRALALPNDVHVDVTWRRSHPLVAWLQVRGRRNSLVPQERAARERWRILWLSPPSLPLPAALTSSGALTAEGATTLSGIDIPIATMPCGVTREVKDVAAVVAAQVGPSAAATWPSMPISQVAPSTVASQLESALPVIASHSTQQVRDSVPAPLPDTPGWRALLLEGPLVVIQGPTTWRGLLTVRGALRLQGKVHLDGLLIVRGGLDARGAQLTVQGAVLVADSLASAVQLGGNSHVTYDRCAVQMALATIATPSSAPFYLWHAPGN